MSQTHVIDNQEPQLFHFDSYGESDQLNMPASDAILSQVNMSANDSEIIAQVSSHNASITHEDTLAKQDEEQTRKGKTVQRSLPIPVPATPSEFDGYSASIASTSHSSTSSADLLTPLTPPYHENYTCNGQRSRGTLVLHEDFEGTDFPLPVSSLKGKERELPPVLPPLAFSPTEFTYLPPTLSIGSPSSGPSSYNSSILQSPHATTDNPTASQEIIIPALLPPATSQESPQSSQPIYRPRSLSDISLQSPGSLAAHSNPQLSTKSTLPGSSSNLARKFLAKKSDAEACNLNQLSSQAVVHSLKTDAADNASGLWCTGLKVDELDAAIARLSNLQIQTNYSYSLHTPFNHVTQAPFGSSQSLPFPLSSPLDIVPPARDFFVPICMITKNYFDDYLPRELRLRIFEALLHLHEGDHLRLVRQGRWSVAKASSSRNRWVGRDRGVCEIVKLSRVSKSWQALAFDGQLWANLNLRPFSNMIESLVLRFTVTGGRCIRMIDLSGHREICATSFLDMADQLCINPSSDLDSICYTQLTVINLQGCSSLTTHSLHHLLSRSPSLQKLRVKGLKAVTNMTFSILSTYNLQLVCLDVSRCAHIDAQGIEHMATAALNRGEPLLLKELRMSGLKHIGHRMMGALGKAAPLLEVLDLSYARNVHNSAVDAFVSCDDEGQYNGSETLQIHPRDLGRSDSNDLRLRRRVTRLRHLSLSYCLLLTDDACSNLAFSLPDLEFLELGGIGTDLRDEGLIRLLKTTPKIRRLDLEDAGSITDAVLIALTPNTNDTSPVPGGALEQLNISFANEITNEALLGLLRSCTKLKHLEADNTNISSNVCKEFVRLCQQRGMSNAKANVVDCRGMTDNAVRDLESMTRPRMGWRSHEARKLTFLDARDGNTDELNVGQDECDEKRVVLKSFYSWQTVDNVKAVREKRRRKREVSGGGDSDVDDGSGRSLHWWSPGGRRTLRSSGRSSPLNIADLNSDGCVVM